MAILDRRIHYFVMNKFYRIRLKLRNTIFFFFLKELNEVLNHINDLGWFYNPKTEIMINEVDLNILYFKCKKKIIKKKKNKNKTNKKLRAFIHHFMYQLLSWQSEVNGDSCEYYSNLRNT